MNTHSNTHNSNSNNHNNNHSNIDLSFRDHPQLLLNPPTGQQALLPNVNKSSLHALHARNESPSAQVCHCSLGTRPRHPLTLISVGARPRCSLCELKDTDCVYDTRAGEARGAHLKRKVTELNSEINYLKGVVNTLRTASWEEAQDLLRRIQSTAELEEALKLISDSSLLLSFRKPSSAEFDGHDGKEDTLYTSPSPPTSEAPKRKRAREEEHQQLQQSQRSQVPRKDPRMSIELLTSAESDARYNATKLVAANDPRYNSTKLVAAAALPYTTGAYTFRPDMINYGSVASDETD